MAYTVPGRDVDSWRALVYRYRGPAVGNGVRVLLLYLADHMKADRTVSVPRPRIAHDLSVSETQIKKRISAAHEAGLLDTVRRGQKGVTAVYQGLFSGTHVVPPERALKGTGNWPPESGFSGTHVGPTSSKRNESDAIGIDSVGTHPSLSSVVASSESKKLPTQPAHDQTHAQTPNDEARSTQTGDHQQAESRQQTQGLTPPEPEPRQTDRSSLQSEPLAWLHDSAVAFATRPTTDASSDGRCTVCGRREPHCRLNAARPGRDHPFSPEVESA